MAASNYFSHTSLDGRRFWERAEAQGIGANAENIARGTSSAQAVLDMWYGSSGHCRSMMNPDYTLIGVGYASAGRFWTQMFKRTEVPVDDSCYPSNDAISIAQIEESKDEALPFAGGLPLHGPDMRPEGHGEAHKEQQL